MKTTLTLNDLSQLLTQNNPSIDKSQAEAFINSFFRNIANRLGADEHITIDGLGSFARDGENNVTFIPDSELAEKVNEPFSFFEAVELDDRFVDSDEPEPEHEPEPAPELNDEEKIVEQTETQPEEKEIEVAEIKEDSADSANSAEAEVAQPEEPEEPAEPAEPVKPAESVEPAVEKPEATPAETPRITEVKVSENITATEKQVEAIDISDAYSSDDISHDGDSTTIAGSFPDDTEEERASGHVKEESWHLPWWISGLAGLFIGFAIGYGINLVSIPLDDYEDEEGEETEEIVEQIEIPVAETPAVTDSIIEEVPSPKVEEQPVQAVQPEQKAEPEQPRTDVVKSGYYLTTMARKYYGKTDFWCYIYEENKAKLGDPNKIPAGTEVVIPPAEKYSINKDDSESLKRAAAKIAEINSRYKK